MKRTLFLVFLVLYISTVAMSQASGSFNTDLPDVDLTYLWVTLGIIGGVILLVLCMLCPLVASALICGPLVPIFILILAGSSIAIMVLIWVFVIGSGVVGLTLIICTPWILLFLVCVCCCCCCFGYCFFKLICKKKKTIDDLVWEEEAGRNSVSETAPGVAMFLQKKDLFEIDWKKVKLIKMIGSGGGGAKIFVAKWGGQEVAFKVFKVTDLSNNEDFEDFERELSVSSSISHPNILRFFGCSLNIPRVGILMEFCENGDLSAWTGKNQGNITFLKKVDILKGIAAGMMYLHEREIIHRDLKGQNVLLDTMEVPKIMDFGLSKVVDRKNAMMTKRVGTSWFIAPEVVLGENYDGKCDVFSWAMLMFELLYEVERAFGTDTVAIENKIAQSEDFRPDIPSDPKFPDWILNMMRESWKHDPKERPTFETLYQILEKEWEALNKEFSEQVQHQEMEGLENKKEEDDGAVPPSPMPTSSQSNQPRNIQISLEINSPGTAQPMMVLPSPNVQMVPVQVPVQVPMHDQPSSGSMQPVQFQQGMGAQVIPLEEIGEGGGSEEGGGGGVY